jgi:hypothetical protein
VTKKTGGAKWHPPLLNSLEYFLERVRDEPEYAAHFAQKTARDVANSLGNHNGRMSVCHVEREVASLHDVEKDKVAFEIQFWILRSTSMLAT